MRVRGLIIVVAAGAWLVGIPSHAVSLERVSIEVVEHGGGCRKAYLPRCCHMDRKRGTFHCH